MSDAAKSGRSTPSAGVALALAFVAGWVDANGWLRFGHVFVAHMSGNTAGFGVHVGASTVAPALHRLVPLPGFLVGVAAGRFAAELARANGVRRTLAWMLLAEAALVVASAAVDGGGAAAIAATTVLAMAMGVQSAALRHAAGHDVRTTFVTGMLVAFADELVARALGKREARSAFAALHAAVWVCFLAGAVIAGAASGAAHGAAAFAPAAMLVVVAGAAARGPSPADPSS